MTLEEEIKRAENKLYYELPKEEARVIIAKASKLPKQGRLETLREAYREYSNGIFVKLKDLASEYSIHDEDLIKPEQAAIDLGIGHYSPPPPNDLAVAFPNLPP